LADVGHHDAPRARPDRVLERPGSVLGVEPPPGRIGLRSPPREDLLDRRGIPEADGVGRPPIAAGREARDDQQCGEQHHRRLLVSESSGTCRAPYSALAGAWGGRSMSRVFAPGWILTICSFSTICRFLASKSSLQVTSTKFSPTSVVIEYRP